MPVKEKAKDDDSGSDDSGDDVGDEDYHPERDRSICISFFFVFFLSNW